MIRWCAYCQSFLGEIPPYGNYGITHGLCKQCAKTGLNLSDAQYIRIQELKVAQDRLRTAGLAGDVDGAVRIVAEVQNQNLKPSDIFVGLVAPLLYEIGTRWECGEITVADEHRFTAFCERLLEPIAKLSPVPARPKVLVVNAIGNTHTIGGRTLALWLRDRGVQAKALPEAKTVEAIQAVFEKFNPTAILISTSLAEQRTGIEAIVQTIEATNLPKPRIIVGGQAVMNGQIAPIANVEQVVDIMKLNL